MGMAFRESMLYVQGKVKEEMNIAEVGVFKGGNAMRLLTLPLKRLYLVDPYASYIQYSQEKPWYVQQKLNDAKAVMLDRVNKHELKDKVETIFLSSVEGATKFEDNFFDYVYIDGNHSYDSVMEDIVAWYPKVKSGRYLAGHDFATLDTAKAVNDFAKANGLEVISWCTPGTENVLDWKKDWLIVKK